MSSVALCDGETTSIGSETERSVPVRDSGRGDSVVDRDSARSSTISAIGALMASGDDVVSALLSIFIASPSSSGSQLLGERMSSGHEELCARGGNPGGVGGCVLLEGVGMMMDV
jgi:hypothetical protein